jgi:hypothetical protein
MWLMLDGTVLAYLSGGTQLMSLRPDTQGSYANGEWTNVGNLLLEKQWFASAVLSDGRVVTCGGELSGPGLSENETNFCEIYDPISATSTQFQPPSGWTNIGDSPSVVLNDGTFMLGNAQGLGFQVALLNASGLSWTFGVGDNDDEQGYVLLQTGDVLTVNPNNTSSMRYDAGSNAFVAIDPDLPVFLGTGTSEIGPGVTLMDGRVIWFGAGPTCIYTPGPKGQNGTWVQGPGLPPLPNGDQLIAADDGAILESNGKVLLQAGAPSLNSAFVEFDPTENAISLVPNQPNSSGARTMCRMLLLPDGHGLVSFEDLGWYDLTFSGNVNPAWAPTITSFPSLVTTGATVTLAGTQLCGLSECQSFGDDNQQAENYPMVRFVDSHNNVTYARARDVSTRSIAPGEPGTVLVDIPSLPPGFYTVYAVAMGIPSAGRQVTVSVSCQTLAKEVWHLIANVSPLTIPLGIRAILERELLACERTLGAAEVRSLIASLFPSQPPPPNRPR